MQNPRSPDLSVFAALLGLPDDADEAAVIRATGALSQAHFIGEVEAALDLPAGSGLPACLAEIDRLRAEEAAFVAQLNAEIAANRSAIRDLRVREMMLDATREAREALHY